MAMEMLDVAEEVCAKYFTMMLEGTARTWLKSLPANSIGSWAELKTGLSRILRILVSSLCRLWTWPLVFKSMGSLQPWVK